MMLTKKGHALVEVAQLIVLQRPDGAILLLEDRLGHWGLPGGRLNDGESWLAALQREVYEESGIIFFTVKTLLGVYQRFSKSSGQNVYGVIFSGVTAEEEITLSSEHAAYEWVYSLEDCDRKNFRLPQVKDAVVGILQR